jgi:hypothetical protein
MSIVVLLLALAILGGGLWAMAWRLRFLAGAARAPAEVLSISTTEDTAGQYQTPVTIYRSSLRFQTPEGGTVSFVHEHGTSKPRFATGDTVPIRYSPGQPAESAEVPSLGFEILTWFSILCALAMGSGFLLAALRMLRP